MDIPMSAYATKRGHPLAFRLDGLGLDAAHTIKDNSQPDIIDELAARLRSRFARPIHLLLLLPLQPLRRSE